MVLKLKLSSSLESSQHFSDLEFVNVKRCLSKLTKLKFLEIDGLTPDQKQQLQQVCQNLNQGSMQVHICGRNGGPLKASSHQIQIQWNACHAIDCVCLMGASLCINMSSYGVELQRCRGSC